MIIQSNNFLYLVFIWHESSNCVKRRKSTTRNTYTLTHCTPREKKTSEIRCKGRLIWKRKLKWFPDMREH